MRGRAAGALLQHLNAYLSCIISISITYVSLRCVSRMLRPADEVYASVRAVVEACAGLGSFPGSELRSALSQATAGFVGSFARALREAAAGGDRVTLRVGQCWAECDAMRKAPTDNRSALTRAFARLLKSMTSAVAELGDAVGGGNEARGSALAEGGGIEVVDWDEGSSEGGEEEDPVAAGVAREKGRVLCDKCVGAIKAYMRTVVTSGEGVEWGVGCEDVGR